MSDPATWSIGGGRTLDLRTPRVMAILNVTPDSFSDGGELATTEAVLERAGRALEAGAAVLDIGGESTRPGADRVPEDEQIRRVVPTIEAIANRWPDAIISIDTTRAAVARAAAGSGAAIVNDVSGGTEDHAMLPAIAALGVGCVLMHRERPPGKDVYSDRYTAPPITHDAVAHVREALARLLTAATEAGIDAERILLDPGLGFGKTVEQNLALIVRTPELLELGRPILSGASRKSFVGRAGLGRDSNPSERLGGSIAASVLHARAGASLFRVHDVAEHVQALRLMRAADGR